MYRPRVGSLCVNRIGKSRTAHGKHVKIQVSVLCACKTIIISGWMHRKLMIVPAPGKGNGQ